VRPCRQVGEVSCAVGAERADLAAARPLVQVLADHGLRVFVDEPEVDQFAGSLPSITEGLS
jgi:hypothetical protein